MLKIKSNHILVIGIGIIYMGGQCHKSFEHLILNGSKILLNLMDIS